VPGRETTMALIGAHVGQLRAERLAPAHRVALVARMPVKDGAGDLGDVTRKHVGIPTEAATGKDERPRADRLARARRAARR
jgi:hypothetical protein